MVLVLNKKGEAEAGPGGGGTESVGAAADSALHGILCAGKEQRAVRGSNAGYFGT